MGLLDAVAATPAEAREPRRGDGLVVPADVVMDRAFTLAGEPAEIWPWIAQLGKRRAGWYLPARVERFARVAAALRCGSSTAGSTSSPVV